MNTDLIMTWKTVLTFCGLVVWRQKKSLTFSCITITIILADLYTSFNGLCEIDMNLPDCSEEKFLNMEALVLVIYNGFSQNKSILNSAIVKRGN